MRICKIEGCERRAWFDRGGQPLCRQHLKAVDGPAAAAAAAKPKRPPAARPASTRKRKPPG